VLHKMAGNWEICADKVEFSLEGQYRLIHHPCRQRRVLGSDSPSSTRMS
jgi:hypothetical protein